jgi:hypothetical protein
MIVRARSRLVERASVDDKLTIALRRFRSGDISRDEALAALARAGITREARTAEAFKLLTHVFREQLDFRGHIGEPTWRPGGVPQPWEAGIGELRFAVRAGRIRVITGTTESMELRWPGPRRVSSNAPGRFIRDPAELWPALTPELIPQEQEQGLAEKLPDTFIANGSAKNGHTVAVHIWHPSRDEILQTGDLNDLRLVVSAPLPERSEIIECIIEAFPHATVLSSAACDATKRPKRHERAKQVEEAPH